MVSDINGAWPQSEAERRVYLLERAIELATSPNPHFWNRPLGDVIAEIAVSIYAAREDIA